MTGTVDDPEPKFVVTDTKLYVLIVTLSAQDNEKPMQPLKTGLKRTINRININQNQHYRHETDISII